MNRFRRKKESKARRKGTTSTISKDADSPSTSHSAHSSTISLGSTRISTGTVQADGTSPSLGLGGSLLPQVNDFRTSLILPQMMKRFSLLRGADGQLVDMETMQNHLAQQRQTGRLTAYEVDAVLAQYRLQSAYETPTPAVPALPKRKRIDWSKVPLEHQPGTGTGIREEDAGRQSTLLSPTSFHTASGSGSLPPFPPSPSPNASVLSFMTTTSSASSPQLSSSSHAPTNPASTTYPYQYKRSKNSMFGGRAHKAKEVKMLRSGSGRSLGSLGSSGVGGASAGAGGTEKREAEEQEQEGEEEGNDAFADAPSPTVDVTSSSFSSPALSSPPGKVMPAPASPPPSPQIPKLPDDLDSPFLAAELSAKQLRRISHALDDIEAELSKSFAWIAEAGEGLVEEEEEEEEAEQEKEGGQPEEEEGGHMIDNGRQDSVQESHPVLLASLPKITSSPLNGLHSSSAGSASPISPISPVNASDLAGLSTFNSPSPPPQSSPPRPSLTEDTFASISPSPPSPALSDTEAVDPFYSRLAAQSQFRATQIPLPPSSSSLASLSSSSPHSSPAGSPHLPSPNHSHSQSPSPSPSSLLSSPSLSFQSMSPAFATDSPRFSDLPPTHASSPLLPPSSSASSTSSLFPSHPPPPSPPQSQTHPIPAPLRLPQSSLDTNTTDSETGTESPSDTETPAAYSFPCVPRSDSGLTARRHDGEEGDGDGKGDRTIDATSPLSDDAEGERTMNLTDEGPFDLSLGKIFFEDHRFFEREEEEEEVDWEIEREGEREIRDPVEVPLPLSRPVSAVSIGSSFHDSGMGEVEEVIGDELDFPDMAEWEVKIEPTSAKTAIFPPSALSRPASLPPSHSDSKAEEAEHDADDLLLRPMSLPLDRRPYEELLAVLSAAARSTSSPSTSTQSHDQHVDDPEHDDGPGSPQPLDDLALSDLVAVQNSLVRAAERRAEAEKKQSSFATASSSSHPHPSFPSTSLTSPDEIEDGNDSAAEEAMEDFLATPSSMASVATTTSSMAEPFSLSAVAAVARTPHTESSPLDGGIAEGGARRGSEDSLVAPPPPLPQSQSPFSVQLSERGAEQGQELDLGARLAGLGLTSVAPFDLVNQPLASAIRNSRRVSVAGVVQRDSGVKARESRRIGEKEDKGVEDVQEGEGEGEGEAEDVPTSSRMTMQTSLTSDTGTRSLGGAFTPSTGEGDAFEFEGLVGSPDTHWSDAQEHLREESLASSSPFADFQPSPVPSQVEEEDESPAENQQRSPREAEPAASPEVSTSAVASPSLGAPAPIDTDSFLRVPRKMPLRDPSTTTSMLIRDVRNQATLATIALKKQNGPASPPMIKPLTKNKSIRKGSISSPQLVSGPIDIPAIPIVQSGLNESSRSSSSSSKVSRSKSKKDKEGEGEKKGLGLRFKMLLKKPASRDQLGHLNGDEITPFVDFETSGVRRESAIPLTPPNPDSSRFSSPIPDFPQTPEMTTPQHSPITRPQPPSLSPAAPDEPIEHLSPVPSASPSIASPASPTGSTNSRSFSRIMSRIRSNGRRGSDASSVVQGSLRDSTTSPDRATSPFAQSAHSRPYSPDDFVSRPSLDQEVIGLGFEEPQEEQSNRAPTSYRVGSPRTRRRLENDFFDQPPTTAPLTLNKHDGPSPTAFSFPPDSAALRSNGLADRASIGSMQQLWQAAEGLGLPPDKVQELVDHAYAQSPTTSSHAHSASLGSFHDPGKRSLDPNRRLESETFNGGTRHRSGSVNSRPGTPPPAPRHLRQASAASSRYAGPVPSIPSACSPPLVQDNSRLSVYSTGAASALAVPHSPSLGSARSSEYANSVIDFYTGGIESEEGEDQHHQQPFEECPPSVLRPLPTVGRRPSLAPSVDEQLAMQQPQNHHYRQDDTVRLNPIGEFQEPPHSPSSADFGRCRNTMSDPDNSDETVWRVLNDLRNNRLSTISKESSFGFESRDSSFEVEREGEQNQTGAPADAIANLLRHRDRKRESVALPPWQKGRYPSLYAADESRLLALGEQGGIAPETQGHFFVRPKEQAPEVPQVPEEYRGQWVGKS
ncbi:hypothetical protein JCM11641_006907 [Rhodosporidiobolus odoratus]